ncbi:MAG: hypothetical protein WCC12_18600 [Anaerolineales bacterium]
MSSENNTIKMDFNGKILKSADGKLTFIYEEPNGCVTILFRRFKIHTVIIDPNTKLVTTDERKIPFAEVEKVETFHVHEQPSMDVIGFHLALKTSERIRLGGSVISRQGDAIPEGYTKISNMLDEVFKNK